MTNESRPPRKRGCFFYGCLTLIILTLIAAVGGVLLFRYVQTQVRGAVAEYTESQPMQLEKADVSPAKLEALRNRINAFREATANRTAPQELVLTADDINTLLANQPDLRDLADKLFVIIEDDQMKAKISWPLPDIGPLKLKGRYLNGIGTFKVSLSKGDLDVRLQDVEVKGKPIPVQILQELRKQDFGEEIQRDQQAAAAINQIDSVEVKDGTVIIRSKP
jgi:hypothetical protein